MGTKRLGIGSPTVLGLASPPSFVLEDDGDADAVFLDVGFDQGIVAGLFGLGVRGNEVVDLLRETADAVHVNGIIAQAARLDVVVVHLRETFVEHFFLTG